MLTKTQSARAGAGEERDPLIIRRVDAIPVALPLKAPMAMSGVTIATAENLLVRLEANGGAVGWGEAASAPTMTGDTLGGLVAAVRDHLAPLLVGQDAFARPKLKAIMARALVGNTGGHSAVEMALLDLAGRVLDRRLIDLIGSERRNAVRPMWLLGNATPDQDIAEARAKEAEGFHLFKLKIGVKPIAKEIAAALAIRKALGPRMPLCADANGGLTFSNAKRYVERTRDAKAGQPGFCRKDQNVARMQRAVLNIDGPRKVEAAGELGYHEASGLGRRRAVLSDGGVKRFGFDVFVSQKRRTAGDTGSNRRDNSRMAEIGCDEPLELGHQAPDAIGREIQLKELDSEHAIALRVVGTVNRPERPGSDLVQHTKWTQRFGGRGAGGVRIQ